MQSQSINKGRITRIDRAWDAAQREAAERAKAGEVSVVEYDQAQAGAVVPFESHMPATIEQEDVPDAVPGLAVPIKYIAAALLVAAKTDIRWYLCGIYLHVVDGDLRIVATDGHRLVASRHPIPEGTPIPEWAQAGVILPRSTIAEVLPLLKRNAIAGEAARGFRRTSGSDDGHIIVAHDPISQRIILRSPNGFAAFHVKPLDGKYPDYAVIMAKAAVNLARGEGDVMQASAIATQYLKGAAEVAERIGSKAIHAFNSNGDAATFFTFDGAPDTAYIVMPCRADEAVSDGVIKMIGSDGIKASVAAFRAHLTRTQKALKGADDGEREKLEARRDSFQEKIAHLIAVTTPAARQLEHRAGA